MIEMEMIDVERALHDAQNMLHDIMGTYLKYVPESEQPFGFSREKYFALNGRMTAALFFLWDEMKRNDATFEKQGGVI